MVAVKKRLIVNADDFGMSHSIDEGVIAGFRKGIITQASIVANGSHFEEAVKLANRLEVPLGIHINLTEGEPCANGNESLVNAEGRFRGKSSFIARTLLGLTSAGEVRREIESQIQKCLNAGIRPIRIDSHHHVHLLPQLQHIFQQVMEKYSIFDVRWISWPRFSVGNFWGTIQQLTARWVSGPGLRSSDVQTSQHFWGLELYRAENKTKSLVEILENLPDGLNELMCHPEAGGNPGRPRQQELTALCSPPVFSVIDRRKIELVDSLMRKKN